MCYRKFLLAIIIPKFHFIFLKVLTFSVFIVLSCNNLQFWKYTMLCPSPCVDRVTGRGIEQMTRQRSKGSARQPSTGGARDQDHNPAVA
jgi:hypothetical protein